MNIFKKNKPSFIAILVNIVINVIVIILLLIIPVQKSHDIAEDLKILLQYEPLDVDPLPPPPKTEKNSKLKKSTEKLINERINKVLTNPIEDDQSISKDTAKADKLTEKDTILNAQIKKMLEDLHTTSPKDSLPDKEMQNESVKTAQEILIEEKRNYDEEGQFYRNNYRTILNIKKMYPYVQKTLKIADNLNRKLATMTNNAEKRRLIKQTEKALFTEFEKDVRKMSFSQGQLFLKLISRETNQSGYNIVKNYKGTFPATFWYGVGLIFHVNLKIQYDSLKEDTLLEKIVVKYKKGKL